MYRLSAADEYCAFALLHARLCDCYLFLRELGFRETGSFFIYCDNKLLHMVVMILVENYDH